MPGEVKQLEMDNKDLSCRLTLAEQKILLYEMIFDRLDVGIHVVNRQESTIVYK